MQHHWKYCQQNDHNNKNTPSERPILNRVDAFSVDSWILPEGIVPAPIDPPQLEDNLAKHIIHVMSRFVYQIDAIEERIVANHSVSAVSTETLTNASGHTLSTSIMVDIYKAASRVIGYVSASNWAMTFAKIKNRILYLTTTAEDTPEVTDVMLLECASLNVRRLGMVLTGNDKFYTFSQLNFMT